MEKYSNLYNTVIKNGYDVRSGVFSIVDPEIKMNMNEFGEYEAQRPASDKLVDERSLLNVSGMADNDFNESIIAKELFGKIQGVKEHPVIGYYKDLYVGHVLEGDYRKTASSGGIATWLFKELLERGLIDGVIHMKPAPKESGVLFRYEISRTIDEVIAGSKTRYYPGELSQVLATVKANPGRYAIVGLPSFIYEVRLLAKQDKAIADSIRYTVGLICGHQKSAKYAENLAWQHGIKPGELSAINFRKKTDDAPASLYSVEMTGKVNGKEAVVTKRHDAFYGGNWGHGFFKTKFSDFTDDALNETADISLGDAWLPEYIKDSAGNNVIIVRNSKIADILNEGAASGALKLDTVDDKTVIRSQPGLIHHTRDQLPYRLFKADKQGIWRPTKRLKATNDLPKLKAKVQDAREFFARQSHPLYQAAVKSQDWQTFRIATEPKVKRYELYYRLMSVQKHGITGITKKLIKKITK